MPAQSCGFHLRLPILQYGSSGFDTIDRDEAQTLIPYSVEQSKQGRIIVDSSAWDGGPIRPLAQGQPFEPLGPVFVELALYPDLIV